MVEDKKKTTKQLIDFSGYLALSSSWNWTGLSWQVGAKVDQKSVVIGDRLDEQVASFKLQLWMGSGEIKIKTKLILS